MPVDIFGPRGPNATSVRPPHSGSTSSVYTWFKDCDPSDPIRAPGTTITAQDKNFIIAQLRAAIVGMGVDPDPNDDEMLWKAIRRAIRGIVNIGDEAPAYKGLDKDGLNHELRTFLGVNGIVVRLNGDTIEIDGSLLGGGGGGGGGVQAGWACTTYSFTGADQDFVVPAGASFVRIKAWGAGAYATAPGGFAEAVFKATGDFAPGAELKVVVGQAGPYHQVNTNGNWITNPPAPYGFGGDPSDGNKTWTSVYTLGAGGGLSGIFTGNGPVLHTDRARARLIAGGAGGIANSNSNASTSGGGHGGDPVYAGGMSTMRGAEFTGGGGGGGYEGGAQTNTRRQGYLTSGEGGSSFVHASALSQNLLATPDGAGWSVPNNSDPDYVAPAGVGKGSSSDPDGHGLVIICTS